MELLLFYPCISVGVNFEKSFHFVRGDFSGGLQITEVLKRHQFSLGGLRLVGVVGHPVEGTGRGKYLYSHLLMVL